MTPAALQHLLVVHAPEVPGITAASARDDSRYGLTITLTSGSRLWWTITGTRPASGSEPARQDNADPVPVPDLTGQPVPVARLDSRYRS